MLFKAGCLVLTEYVKPKFPREFVKGFFVYTKAALVLLTFEMAHSWRHFVLLNSLLLCTLSKVATEADHLLVETCHSRTTSATLSFVLLAQRGKEDLTLSDYELESEY